MDPENQALIKRIVEEFGADDIVVMLGAGDAEAVEVAAETVRDGDPAWVGPLAGVQLGLPVLHVFEDDVKEQSDRSVYEEQIGFFEMTLGRRGGERGDAPSAGRGVAHPVIGLSGAGGGGAWSSSYHLPPPISPPSTTSVWAEMNRASSLARKSTAIA